MSFENSLSVIGKFIPGIPQRINFNSLWFFLTHVYFLDSLKLLLCCKHVIVSFILVYGKSTILSTISLSKYKWKVSSIFSILLALEFGARRLILPEMISHFRCLPVATGCSELQQIFFVILSFCGLR